MVGRNHHRNKSPLTMSLKLTPHHRRSTARDRAAHRLRLKLIKNITHKHREPKAWLIHDHPMEDVDSIWDG